MGTDITIEVLYGEFADCLGKLQNVNYLRKVCGATVYLLPAYMINQHTEEGRATWRR